ncbi:tRNA-dihydrouridine synthase [uncultured Campylobacter sp.]|uniref:oxidoreductase n=1 Tax=uncultured Campylobacter sp. TaxID=218934 RepID=UPI00261612F9|nr:tRNA-dihydrouridine synthase [uncultured Campylobacter sp.]
MKLLSSVSFGSYEAKNRVVMPPMCLYMAKDDGMVEPFHHTHYAARAIGEVGTIIVEATAVQKRGRISDFDLGLWDDSQIDSHAKLVKEIKSYGALVGVQLSHAGRKSKSSTTKPVAPSKSKFSDEYDEARELSIDEIYEIIDSFISASKRAVEAGYDFVEIHGAHGYLIHQFLSPLTNLRDDKFGKDLLSRFNFLFEIVSRLKKENIVFGVRISASEWESGGFDIEDSKKLAVWLDFLGASYIHVSSGGNHEKPSLMPKIEPFYQCGYAKEIKKVVNIPVIAVGLITTPNEGEALLKGEVCDMVAYGRELLRNPNLVLFALANSDKSKIPNPYKRAFL